MTSLTVNLDAEDDKMDQHTALGSNIANPTRDRGLSPEDEKSDDGSSYLQMSGGKSRRSSIDTLSAVSVNKVHERSPAQPVVSTSHALPSSYSPVMAPSLKDKWAVFVHRNKGVAMVLLAQMFAALMATATRLLETEGEDSMHPLQILFARMSITWILSSVYLWWAKVPDAPFGTKEVRGLIFFRSLGGFFGVYGLYYSLIYLPLAEATVITFLSPIVTCWACSILLHESFTRMEQIAGLVSLIGVVIIARPTSLFFSGSASVAAGSGADNVFPATNSTVPTDQTGLQHVAPVHRLMAIGAALIGVLGAACAYTSIKWIGHRAHPLISVTCYSLACVIVSTIGLLAVPGIGFRLPSNGTEWGYLFFLGVCGFVMQFLLTAGLAHEKSSRATNMVYSQMLFALAFDQLIFHITPGVWSIIGSVLILGSVLYVAMRNQSAKPRPKDSGLGLGGTDEEVGLMNEMEDAVCEEDDGAVDQLRVDQAVPLDSIR